MLMTKVQGAAVVFAALFSGVPANAGKGPPPPPAAVVNGEDTSAFVGLNWVLGAQPTLEGVIGVISQTTDSAGKVNGAQLSFNYPLAGGGSASVILSGLFGDTDLQGEVGAGYALDGSFFGLAGGHMDYLSFGSRVDLSGVFFPYIGIDSYGNFVAPPAAPPPLLEVVAD
jgi:hypothetical protein